MEEIIDRCARLKLLMREDVEVEINAPLKEDGLVLIGKFVLSEESIWSQWPEC